MTRHFTVAIFLMVALILLSRGPVQPSWAEPDEKKEAKNPEGVPNEYEVADTFLRDTPGKTLGEKLKVVLGEEATKNVKITIVLGDPGHYIANFTWLPKKVSLGQKVRVFLPSLYTGEVTVKANGKAVWTMDEGGNKLLSPEIELPKTRKDKETPVLRRRTKITPHFFLVGCGLNRWSLAA